MASLYPFEVLIDGVPISQQVKRATSRGKWQAHVIEAARERQRATDELGFLDKRPLAATVYYFSDEPMEGDIDNIVKPILDTLKGIAYLDDAQVERVLAQRFDSTFEFTFSAPSAQLAEALDTPRPVVFVRIDDDLTWRTLS